MAFLDWLTGKIECPSCGTSGAKVINGSIQCPNPTCAYFSKTMGKSEAGPPGPSISLSQRTDVPAGSFGGASANVPAGSFAIQYRDFRGQERTFIAQADSAYRVKNHISVKVAPQGRRIALSRDRILNLSDVEAAFPQRVAPGQEWPSARERRILNYHKAGKTTSPLYESIRAKYPSW
jgi:hypothetical protein